MSLERRLTDLFLTDRSVSIWALLLIGLIIVTDFLTGNAYIIGFLFGVAAVYICLLVMVKFGQDTVLQERLINFARQHPVFSLSLVGVVYALAAGQYITYGAWLLYQRFWPGLIFLAAAFYCLAAFGACLLMAALRYSGWWTPCREIIIKEIDP